MKIVPKYYADANEDWRNFYCAVAVPEDALHDNWVLPELLPVLCGSVDEQRLIQYDRLVGSNMEHIKSGGAHFYIPPNHPAHKELQAAIAETGLHFDPERAMCISSQPNFPQHDKVYRIRKPAIALYLTLHGEERLLHNPGFLRDVFNWIEAHATTHWCGNIYIGSVGDE